MNDVKDKVKYHYDELEEYSGKWTGLYFMKSGISNIDCDTQDTEEEAQAVIDDILASNPFKWHMEFKDGSTSQIPDICYAMPIPIG